ncbi:MAG: hypothetical protein ACI3XQ_01155 [Eubacteriales bacterium]
MKSFLKAIVVFAVLIGILVFPLSGCKPKETGTAETTATTVKEEDTYVKDNLPDGLRFDDKIVNIYWRNDENYAASTNANVVNDALVARDMYIRDRFGVKLNHINSEYLWDTRTDYLSKISASSMAGDDSFMLVVGHYHVMPQLILTGCLMNMNGTGYLDFNNPWWMGGLVEDTAINGKMYLAMGDFTVSYTNEVACYFLNESMLETYCSTTKEEFYQTVFDGNWTYELFLNYIKGVYASSSGGDKKELDDTYGFTVYFTNVANYMEGFKMDVVEKGVDDKLSVTINSERNIEIIDALKKLCWENQDVYYTYQYQEEPQFDAGKIMFKVDMMSFARNLGTSENTELKWGVAPFPKWDELQEDYCSGIGNWYDFIGMTNCGADVDLTTAMLEAMSCYSYNYVSKAIFEDQFQLRYSQDLITSRMFEFVREHITVNYGCAYGDYFSSINQMVKLSVGNQLAWSSYYEKNGPAAEYYVAKFEKALANLN